MLGPKQCPQIILDYLSLNGLSCIILSKINKLIKMLNRLPLLDYRIIEPGE